ncbi:unnamed protein product, partial [Closterium sp. Naga37s-1]
MGGQGRSCSARWETRTPDSFVCVWKAGVRPPFTISNPLSVPHSQVFNTIIGGSGSKLERALGDANLFVCGKRVFDPPLPCQTLFSDPHSQVFNTIIGGSGSKLERALGDAFPEGERYSGLEPR